jgi:NitT/TauT family transport system substrate-binding protein
MHTIDLAYVGRGIHEELVAYIADPEDFYAAEDVHVALHDGCSWDIERLRHGLMIGLGRALLSRLTDGTPWIAVNVNTHSPLFWFIARPGIKSLADLKGQRLAVHAPDNPPGSFARIALRRAGLDPDNDLQSIFRFPGDYSMDLRKLTAGEIDAAYVGSTMAPEAVAAEHGWEMTAWVGDHFNIPTVGVALDPTYVDPESPAVQAVIRAHRRALRVIKEDPETTVRHILSFHGGHTPAEARAHYDRFIAPYYTADGQADLAIGEVAIPAVAAELGVTPTFTAAEFYRTSPTAA